MAEEERRRILLEWDPQARCFTAWVPGELRLALTPGEEGWRVESFETRAEQLEFSGEMGMASLRDFEGSDTEARVLAALDEVGRAGNRAMDLPLGVDSLGHLPSLTWPG